MLLSAVIFFWKITAVVVCLYYVMLVYHFCLPNFLFFFLYMLPMYKNFEYFGTLKAVI